MALAALEKALLLRALLRMTPAYEEKLSQASSCRSHDSSERHNEMEAGFSDFGYILYPILFPLQCVPNMYPFPSASSSHSSNSAAGPEKMDPLFEVLLLFLFDRMFGCSRFLLIMRRSNLVERLSLPRLETQNVFLR
jgi:hypothetical protein